MGTLFQDLRYGARMLLKQPGFTLIAVITLALGIGANTMIFSFVNALLLRPLPAIAEQERLVRVGRTMNNAGFDTLSYPNYVDYRDQNTTLSGLAASYTTALHLSAGGEAERVRGALVTGNYFSVLGAPASQGRTLLPDDDKAPGASFVMCISEGLWRRRFGADPNIVGKTATLNAQTFTIVGVAAAGFVGTQTGEKLDIWVPLTMYAQMEPTFWRGADKVLTTRNASWLEAFGRLKPGVRIEQAQAELSVIARKHQQAYPETNREVGVTLVAGLGFEPETRAEVEQFTGLLLGVVGLVLLIACANVANMLLARATVRQKEIGIRLALGARRARIVRQLLTESLLLALLGGGLGVVLALWANDLLAKFLPPSFQGLPLGVDLSLDRRVLAFTVTISLLTGIFFGLIPALQASRPELVPVLKDTVASGRGTRQARLRGALIVSQLALSFVVLVCAGLFVRTLRNSRAIQPGFAVDRVLTMQLDVGRQGYSEEQGKLYYRRLTERVAPLPGVESVSLVLQLPLGGGSWGTGIRVEGKRLTPDDQPLPTDYNVVTPRYFATMGSGLLLGRDFTERDVAESPGVVIINETLARRLWPDENPLGKRMVMGPEKKPLEVIGVAKDSKHRSLFEAPRTLMYVPVAQTYRSTMTLLVRTANDPTNSIAAVQREARALDPNLPIFRIKTLATQLSNSLMPQRLAAALVTAFGAIALLLAAIGLYGVMAYTVSQRTREIGIRMALGAQARDVLRLVVRQGMFIALLGVLIGLAAALALTRLMTSLLFGVSATDPLTFGVIALLLALVALLACYIPARRATRVDPLKALRYE